VDLHEEQNLKKYIKYVIERTAPGKGLGKVFRFVKLKDPVAAHKKAYVKKKKHRGFPSREQPMKQPTKQSTTHW
jgi:hypothetical protein